MRLSSQHPAKGTRMATITDVARLAGVSKNTVSRYLNKRGYISDKTRRAIASAIDELHYQPNQIARSLYTRRTNLVGLVIPNVEHPFFAAVTSRIEDELDSRGYKMILCNTLHSTRKERQYILRIRSMGSSSVRTRLILTIPRLLHPWLRWIDILRTIYRWLHQTMLKADELLRKPSLIDIVTK